MSRSLPLAVLLALHAWGGGAGRAAQAPGKDEPAKVDIPDSAFEFLRPLRGASGEVRVVLRLPGAELLRGPLPQGTSVLFEDGEGGDALASLRAPSRPGVYDIVVKRGEHGRKASDLKLVTLVPFASKQRGRIGDYQIGTWPAEAGKPRSRAYASPPGFVEVTKQNKSLRVSKHFELEDFLSKGQDGVWPKYVVLDVRLLDKLELVEQELEATGRDVEVLHVMSGFRTPSYNATGGDTSGRGELSRHMWGDAADIWVDDDRDGRMDDLNGDKLSDLEDAREIAAAAERVEARHPELAGGVGPYPSCCGHGPFTHVDARGTRARWQGPHPPAATPRPRR
jgi:uncharacterized protein YcbK (DUF882 family)